MISKWRDSLEITDSNACTLMPKNFHRLFSYAGNSYVENNGSFSTVDYRLITAKWFGMNGKNFIQSLCTGGRIVAKIRKIVSRFKLEERPIEK